MFTRLQQAFLLSALGCGLILGCGSEGKVKEKTIEITPIDQLEVAKNCLNNYVNGQPLGSEVTSFPTIVEGVKQKDPAKGQILEKGFADLQKPGTNVPSKAKEILAQLK